MYYFMPFVVLLDKYERGGCFAFIVFWMSCYCTCTVALPHGVVAGLQFVNLVSSDHTHLLCVICMNVCTTRGAIRV